MAGFKRPLRIGLSKPILARQISSQDTTTLEVKTPALFITSPWKGWPTPDIFPNVALIAFATLAALSASRAMAEPTYFKRSAPQIDSSPNIAVLAQPTSIVRAPLYINAPTRRNALQLDQPVNIAVSLQTQQLAGEYIDPVLWKAKPLQLEIYSNIAAIPIVSVRAASLLEPQLSVRQAPQLDVFPNLAAQTEIVPVIRSPLYVSYRAVNWVAPDVYPNVSVRVVSPASPPPSGDPLLWKRLPPQIDLPPNIAVNLQTQRPAGTYLDPLVRRYVIPPDVYPNIAVNLQTQTPAGSYVEPQLWKRAPLQSDLYPNIAARQPVVTALVASLLDPQLFQRRALQPDLFPNLSAQTETVPTVRMPLYVTAKWTGWAAPDIYPNVTVRGLPPAPPARLPIEPTFTTKWTQAPDVYPNLAAQTEAVPVVRTPLYINYQPAKWAVSDVYPNIAVLGSPAIGNVTTWADLPIGRWPQVDLYPNIAVRIALLAPSIPPPIEPTFNRKPSPQVELSPNIAVNLQTQRPAGAYIEPQLWKIPSPQIDILPDLAVTFVAPRLTPPLPIEPTYTWKWAAAPELSPNIAAKATPAATILILPMIEPTYTHKWTLQFDYIPNIAVMIPSVTPTGLHEIGLGFTWIRLGGRVGGN
jgi:hypothetical protein